MSTIPYLAAAAVSAVSFGRAVSRVSSTILLYGLEMFSSLSKYPRLVADSRCTYGSAKPHSRGCSIILCNDRSAFN